MRRCWSVLLSLLVLVAARPAAAGHGGYMDPMALGVQARAVVDADGNLDILCQEVVPVYETQYHPETRTREVTKDGLKRTEAYTIMVPSMVCKQVGVKRVVKLPAASVEVYHMNGAQARADVVRTALAERATVLVASQKVPSYYLAIYKPDTLLIVVKQTQWQFPGGGGPPRAASAPPAEEPIFVQVPTPVPIPAPSANPPVANPAPAAEAPAEPQDKFGLGGVRPTVQFASWSGHRLALRTYLRDVVKQTTSSTIEQNGEQRQIQTEIEIDSISDIQRTYAPVAVKISRADKKPVTSNQLQNLLSRERAVLVSTNGQPVDPSFLEIVRPDTLVAIPPPPRMEGMVPAVAMPAPAAPYSAPAPYTAPAPMPDVPPSPQ